MINFIILIFLSSIYFYLYFSLILNYFFNIKVIRYFFSYYFNYVNIIINITNLSNKIFFLNKIKINKNENNLIIINHNSILDHLIIFKLGNINNFGWNDIRTVSRISSKKLQNKILKLFDSFLVTKKYKTDLNYFKYIKKKWLETNKPLQFILYPEGTIFNNNSNNKYTKFHIRELKNLMYPHSGIFNLIKNNIKIENIYHLTIVFKIKNKRLVGEKEILSNLSNSNLQIIVSMSKTNNKNIDDLWLFKRWENSDNLIDKILKA